MTIDIPEGYESLGLALGEAVAQASRGKGADRHAEKGEPFSEQLIMSIPKRLGPGGECFCLGQALKKICESRRLPPDRARAELLGAINYIAAAWCLLGGSASVPEDAPLERLFRPGEDVEVFDGREWRTASYVRPEDGGLHSVLCGTSRFAVQASAIRKPSFAPGDADAPRFLMGELVEYRLRDGTWKPAGFEGMDGGFAIVMSGGEKIRVPACDVRPAESAPSAPAGAPLFAEGTPIEYVEKNVWKPGVYIGVDPEGSHVVECRGVRRHLDRILVRKA